MQLKNIAKLLQNTLDSSITRQAESSLKNFRQNQGFITQLLIIGDEKSYNINIRLSALIHIKNAIVDFFKNNMILPQTDYNVIRSSILHALIRNCQQKSISPTIRQIIFTLAHKQSPSHWQIIPQIANYIQNSGDFNQIYGSVEALKAIVSAFGKTVDQTITMFNLCNKIVLPLLNLSSKLFQNYNDATSIILISIFKIFSTITYFNIPEIILMNIHSWMIFIKKILDLNIQSSNIDKNMYQLKKICLRIVFRFYQKHMNKRNFDFSKQIVLEFHKKFTNGIVESLLLQIMNQANIAKNNKNKRYCELTKYALSSLSYICGEDLNTASIINQYRQKIIFLCLERYKIRFDKKYSSFNDFSQKISEQRGHFCQFICSIIKNEINMTQQLKNSSNLVSSSNIVNKILQNLFEHISKGDMDIKELCLYVFASISDLLPLANQNIEQKMLLFILNYIKPLLRNESTPILVKLRCCQILTKYSYISIPQNELIQFGESVYGYLIINSNEPMNNDMRTFLQIHAVHAFNSLLRYESFVKYTSAFISNILHVYTSLLQIQTSIIKCLEDMLDKFQNYLQPYGQSLIQILSKMYFKYFNMINQNKKMPVQNKYFRYKQNHTNNQNDQSDDQEDNSSDYQNNMQEIQDNCLQASKACLAAIRQIVQSPSFQLQKDYLIHQILIKAFTDKDELFTQEAFNILNLVLFKQKYIKSQYNMYFTIIINGILPIPSSLIEILRNNNTDYNKIVLNMLECVCKNPDPDFIQNSIGCLRNFIAKCQNNLKNQYDQIGRSFLSLIFEVTKYVHQNMYQKQSNLSATQSQRSIILTLYISLIEWKVLDQNQLIKLLQSVNYWMNLEKSNQSNQTNQLNFKYSYTPIYIQIILLSFHFYPQVTLKIINTNQIISQLLINFHKFSSDYQIARVLIGVSDILNYGLLTDSNLSSLLINQIPDLIQKSCNIRLNQQQNNTNNLDDQAEQDILFGMDQNTHIMGWRKNNINIQNQNNSKSIPMKEQQQEQEQAESQDWTQQFNKYYVSPLDFIDQIQYVLDILKSNNFSPYLSLMGNQAQSKLGLIFNSYPVKFDKN